ncbi:MAG: BamA/TamA family outer membrane protein [Bacteroidales bacterium]
MLTAGVYAQPEADTLKAKVEKDCRPKSLGDLFRKKDLPPRPPKNFTALVLPNISSNPSNGLLLGVGGALGWWFGPKETTRISSAGFTAAWTTKNQWIFFVKSNAYTSNDKFFLQSDWRYYIYSQPTFGLGTNAPDSVELDPSWGWMAAPTGDEPGAYPLKFNYFKFHEIVSYKIKTNFYGGIGFHLDHYSNIRDILLNASDTLEIKEITPHYAYSEYYGFNPEKYTLTGLSLNFVFDSRDNLINPYKGMYFNLNLKQNFTFLGSDRNSTFLFFDYRYYRGLSKRMPRHVIGAWLWGNFMVAGRAPYLTLQAIGDDQRARSGRGYIQGRYRGEKFLYGEIEYRFPISRCSQILGGVVFLNATTASNNSTGVKLFQYIQPGFGAGLRVMINTTSRTNINLDFGVGKKSKGFYFSGAETF